MTTADIARFTMEPNGDVTIDLHEAATSEEEAVAVAIAEELCAAANGMADEDDSEFAAFCRQRTAASPKPQRQAAEKQEQLMLLSHLDDLPAQRSFWEES